MTTQLADDDEINKAFHGPNGPPPPSRGPGRPKGSKNRRHAIVEALMHDEAAELARAVINSAKGGDMTAMRIIMDRIAPIRRGRPVRLDLPPVIDAAGLAEVYDFAVLRAMADGELTPEEAASVAAILEARRKLLETLEFAERLAEIEKKLAP